VPGRPQRAAVLRVPAGRQRHDGVRAIRRNSAQFCAYLPPSSDARSALPFRCHGQSYDTKDSCDQKCTHPDPPPPELIGLWRGLELHKGYRGRCADGERRAQRGCLGRAPAAATDAEKGGGGGDGDRAARGERDVAGRQTAGRRRRRRCRRRRRRRRCGRWRRRWW
jgi:hypothetical protein